MSSNFQEPKAPGKAPGKAPESNPQTPLDGASSVFAAVIEQDENLLWQSRAGAEAYALAHVRAVFMGLTFFLAAIMWNAVVSRGAVMAELGLVAWLFAAVGAAYVLLPVMAYVKGKWFLFYALTNRRLIILQLYPTRRVDSFPIKTLNRVAAHNVSLGHGTLLIDAPGAVVNNAVTPRAGFYGVKHVTMVIEAVETLQDPEAVLQRVHAQQAQKAEQAQNHIQPQPESPPRFVPSSSAMSTVPKAATMRVLH